MSARPIDEKANDEKRRAILSAALRTFSAQGFKASRIQAIADAAGVSSALLYHYFKDKEAIFTCLVDEALDSSLNSYKAAASIVAEPIVKIFAVLDAVFTHGFAGDGPYYFGIMIQAMTLQDLPAEVRAEIGSRVSGYWTILAPAAEEACTKRQVLAPDASTLLTLINALIQGLAVIVAQSRLDFAVPSSLTIMKCITAPESLALVEAWNKNLSGCVEKT